MRRICPRCNGRASVVEESLGRIDRADPRFGTPRFQAEAMLPILDDLLEWLRGIHGYAPEPDELAEAGTLLAQTRERLGRWVDDQRRAEGTPEPPAPHDPGCRACDWCAPFEVAT